MNLVERTRLLIIFRMAFLGVIAASAVLLHVYYQDPIPTGLTKLLMAGFAFSFLSWICLLIWPSRSLCWAQVMWDLLFTAVLVMMTGAVESAFTALFSIYILTAAAVLGYRAAMVATFVSVTAYAAMVLMTDEPMIYLQRIVIMGCLLLLFGAAVSLFFRSKDHLKKNLEHTRANLDELNQIHSAIIDHINSGILFADRNGMVIFINSAGQKILGGDLHGQSLLGTAFEILLKAAERSESEFNVAEQTRIFGYQTTVLSNQCSVVVFQDVTHVREIESKLKLQERLAAVGQLAAGIAHEIRNPLASLSGSIQVLKQELRLSDESDRLMKIVLRETDRLDLLAKDFLDYAKPSQLQLSKVAVEHTILEILTLMKNQSDFSSRKIEFAVQCTDQLTLEADEKQFRQVIWNLVRNAVDAIREKGVVSFDARQVDQVVEIDIRDTGVGMSQDEMARAFEPFFSTKESGTGLGLSLVYQILRSHGGQISIESSSEQGTSVHMQWPKFQQSRAA